MTTMRGKDSLDDEIAAWLAGVQADQAPAKLVERLHAERAKAAAIKDPNSPAAVEAHERINAVLGAMGL